MSARPSSAGAMAPGRPAVPEDPRATTAALPSSARRIRLSIVLGMSVLLIAQVLAVSQFVTKGRDTAITAATGLAERIGRSVEGAVNRALVQVDATMLGLPLLLAPLTGEQTRNIAGVNAALRQINTQNFAFRDLLLVGPDGQPIAAALPASRRRSLPVPLGPNFQEAGLYAGGLAIGGPALNPATAEFSLFFTRTLQLASFGTVHGVAEVTLSSLATLLNAGGEAPGLRVWIERADGTLLASSPQDNALLGQRIADPAEPGPATIRPSRLDGREVIVATRPTIYPHIRIVAEMDLDPVLADWRDDRDRAALFSVVLTLVLVALMISLLVWVTQRSRVETERLRWRLRLESALNSMSDGFVMFDAEDRLIVSNQSYREMYELSAPFIEEGARFEDIVREGARRGQYPQLKGDIDSFIRELQEQRRAGGLIVERLLPGGRWILITERVMPDGGTVGIRTDITALKAAMTQLAAARDEAEKATVARGMFLARMSHELRTPLNAVLGYAQIVLQDQNIQGESRDRLRLMHDAAAHLRDVVNTLLDLTKAEAGKLELRPTPTALRPLAEACIALVMPEVERKRIAIALDMEASLPATVSVDAMRLRQVLINLLSNAVKFSPQGGRVALRLRATPSPGIVRFEVEDSGPGVPPEQRERLFRDFSQLQAGSDNGTGTGLGLAISAQLVAAMSGRIGVGDGGGPGAAQGAMFWAEVPLPAVEKTPAPPAMPSPPLPAAAAPPAEDGDRPLRLLVVDDIAVNRTLARVMLEQAGHQVTLAADGGEALTAVEAHTFDAVLMDVQMPVMDGLEAARRIRLLPGEARRVPIIALTASAMTDQVEACRAAGMDAHLAKPINRAEMLTAVAEIARRRHEGDEGSPLPAASLDRLRAELGADAGRIIAELAREARDGLRQLPAASPIATEVAAATHRLLGPLRALGAVPLAEATATLEAAARKGLSLDAPLQAWRGAATALEPHLDALIPRGGPPMTEPQPAMHHG
ncbi:response regulator [Roseococcus sp. SYP-B2431]|uniref:PAS-domain containing protein n=1 Tax=Roseococcus sp. SYP-B2431 TaxID=2496640 RepID=UPI0010394582|nr:PAS-domain containing protein [Roseococcus sp. SYP-B2431]TCH99444.1 response regulator [Roseococcus sp. SYP-B2431]